MEVAVAAAVAGRALRRAGGKRGLGRGGLGPGRGRGASGAAGWAVSRARGGRPDGRLPRAPVAGVRSAELLAPCGDGDTHGAGVGNVGLAQAVWFSGHGCQKTHPSLGVVVAAQV